MANDKLELEVYLFDRQLRNIGKTISKCEIILSGDSHKGTNWAANMRATHQDGYIVVQRQTLNIAIWTLKTWSNELRTGPKKEGWWINGGLSINLCNHQEIGDDGG